MKDVIIIVTKLLKFYVGTHIICVIKVPIQKVLRGVKYLVIGLFVEVLIHR